MAEHSREQIIARWIARYAVRDSELENLHAGTGPSSMTGDYSDVKVVSPYGEIPWMEASRISDEEMRALMLDIEENLTKLLRDLFSNVRAEALTRLDRKLPRLEEIMWARGCATWDRPDFSTSE